MTQREDSQAKLRRLLADARAKIRELEAREPEVVVEVREVIREVPGPERIVQLPPVTVEVEKIVQLPPVTVEVIREVEVERIVQLPPEIIEVERVIQSPPVTITVEVERIVQSPPVTVEVERIVYQDNPEHIEMIRKLQAKICQSFSV